MEPIALNAAVAWVSSTASGFAAPFLAAGVVVAPEPPTIILMTVGLVGMGLYARRRFRSKSDS